MQKENALFQGLQGKEERELPWCNTDPFFNALKQIEPDARIQGRAAYSIDRAAALLNVQPKTLLAWAERRYEFRTIGGLPADYEVVCSGQVKITRDGLAVLKAALDKEPRPFPPLTKANARTPEHIKFIKMIRRRDAAKAKKLDS